MRRALALLAALPALVPAAALACGTGVSTSSGSSNTTFSIQGLVPGWIGTGAGVGGFLAIAVLAVMAAVAVLLVQRSRRPAAMVPMAAVPVYATRSPDGHYWWDGQSWQPLSSR
jgi:hypothetical protein